MNRAPGVIWSLRRPRGLYFDQPYIRTNDSDGISISFPDGVGYATTHYVTREDARLLAKRINQCLDATVKK